MKLLISILCGIVGVYVKYADDVHLGQYVPVLEAGTMKLLVASAGQM